MKRTASVLFFLFLTLALAEGAAAMTVISPVLELAGDPGKTVTGVVKLFNETDQPLKLLSSVEPFSASDESGQPKYLPPLEKNAYLQWFAVSRTSLDLKARQAAIVPFSVVIPADAVPGGYYAAIFWKISPPAAAGSALSISSKVGTLVLLKVSGDINESGAIEEFSDSAKNNLIYNFPLNFIVRFANTGNVHLSPTGEITVKNRLGKEIILPVNPGNNYVLPASVRRFEVAWANGESAAGFFADFWRQAQNEWQAGAIGPLTATVKLSFGENGRAEKSFDFWFFPWHLAVIAFGSLILLYILYRIDRRVRKLKKLARVPNERSKLRGA